MIISMSGKQNWHKDLFSCCDAFPVFMLNCFCPVIGTAITQYMAHKSISELNAEVTFTLALCCCCLGNIINRKRMRSKLHLKGFFLCDCCLYLCGCYSCMAMQEYQEVNWQILNKMIDKPLY
jgi:Cys-rich protein (TIGR01571 family)